MILSSSSPTPSNSTIFANASLSLQVFLDGVAVQSTDDGRCSFTVPQSSRSLLFVQLSGALALLNFSFSIDSAVSALPVRPAIHCLHRCLPWFPMQRVMLPLQVLVSGMLFSTSSTYKQKVYIHIVT
jgi:hypothetical protein